MSQGRSVGEESGFTPHRLELPLSFMPAPGKVRPSMVTSAVIHSLSPLSRYSSIMAAYSASSSVTWMSWTVDESHTGLVWAGRGESGAVCAAAGTPVRPIVIASDAPAAARALLIHLMGGTSMAAE